MKENEIFPSQQNKYKFAPYSSSKIKMYDECPFKFHQYYVLKNRPPMEPKPFFEKGTFIHWILEHFPKIPKVPFEFKLANKKMQDEWLELAKKIVKSERVRKVLKEKIKSEMKFSLNFDFKPVEFDKNTSLLMGYIDNISKGEKYKITDWKTGTSKVSEDDIQLKLYALWFLLGAKKVQEVECTYAFVEQDEWLTKIYAQENVQDLKNLFINKIESIENCTDFVKKPNRKCTWCDYENECQPFKFKLGEKNVKRMDG